MLVGIMEDGSDLLSALRSLSDGDRAAVETGLVPLARSAALGDLAADFAHDVANSLFGILGLAELLLDDVEPGSEDEERLRLLRQTAVELKGSLQGLLGLTRADPEATGPGDLAASARTALAAARYGVGRSLTVTERYPDEPVLVDCPEPLLVEAALHLVLGARAAGGPVTVAVEARSLRVAPAGPESLGLLAAGRIAAAHGGRLERSGDAVALVFD
jgi:signal transduction histidine kinase